ncbi:hypothetical protein C0995_012973 [Termitomyces sp. Mi166|nr:hypothetical protein C0995_012973 [Termitomyces sp. Mi166\
MAFDNDALAYKAHNSNSQSLNSVAATIPLDIFVDNISPYLHVEDILALRRVNKHYFHLTHEPLIWKRFLQQLKIPLPPIRPTLNYSVRSSDYEYEQLVSRAISLEDNWRKKKPIVYSTMSFDACLEVLDMKLLPGGKYLIASIRDDYRFFIALYHLDHPSGPHILARCQISTKAYQLQAKYMTYKRKPVIMIAYLCRELNEGGPANIDPAKFANNATVDLPAQITHFLNCVHVDLSTLDLLAGAHRDPTGFETTKHKLLSSNNRYKPFMPVVRLPLETPTAQLSLYSQSGVAHASVIQQAKPEPDGQDYLVIVNIEHPHLPCQLICQPYVYPDNLHLNVNYLHPDMQQWVKAVRHLPEQNQVLIWRTIVTGQYSDPHHPEPRRLVKRHAHGIEILDMPNKTHEGGITFATPRAGRLVLPVGDVQVIHMTDDVWPSHERSDLAPQASLQPPPPISVYIEMMNPHCIDHLHIWPEKARTPETKPSYIYNLRNITKQTRHDARPDIGHVLPGVFRSLIYTTGSTDRTATPFLTSLRRYISPEFQHNNYPLERVQRHSAVERNNYARMPYNVYTKLEIGPEATARYRDHGLGAIAWDQTTGRVCLTTGGGSIIEVIDFSYAALPDERFLDWKMTSPGGFERIDQEEGGNEFVVARRARSKRDPDLEGLGVDEDVDMDTDTDSDDYFSDT